MCLSPFFTPSQNHFRYLGTWIVLDSLNSVGGTLGSRAPSDILLFHLRSEYTVALGSYQHLTYLFDWSGAGSFLRGKPENSYKVGRGAGTY